MFHTIKLLILTIFISITHVHSVTYRCNPTLKCGCSKNSTVTTSKIIGGELANDHTWNWIVSLRRSNSHICGASLLTAEYAVTAAHCVYGKYKSDLSIAAGSNYLFQTSMQKRNIIDITIHPNYNSQSEANDIAILKFTPLNTSPKSNINFICLPERGQDPFKTGSNLVAIGWGVTKSGSSSSASFLRQVTLQAYSSTSADCLDSGMTQPNIQFCAGTRQGGKDTCQGDSGGPLMAFVNNHWVLAGVTSFGKGCAIKGYPGVYTRVSAFIPYINSKINLSIARQPPKNEGRSIYRSIILMLWWFQATAYVYFSY